ncbi:MAG: hypothetical protein KGK03_04450 [Candidatus Omnitrophica bacterium]|nr:hypothetical protein [Candidatus Omnitrophota bacterium]MDE2222304.1 hypothetical protein [Candidatus Omnitrophota bacterium]
MGKTKSFLFDAKETKYLWRYSDDAMRTTRRLSEMYPDIPKKLDAVVHVIEFHKLTSIPRSKRTKILNWLDKE